MTGSFNYIPIIGLEVHVELKTASKMFCACRNDPFHAVKPNIYTCPVCLGLPGALPVPNKKAIELTVKLGLGLGCGINKESRFDRKHYFYPDLPKGYQISQYEKPFATNGRLQVTGYRLQEKIIRIRRVHLEEDTGKLLHRQIDGEDVSLIDFNRSGVPLAEIVTEPDIRSAQEAKETAKKIHQIVRALGVSDADMEKGSMRLEANVSLLEVKRTNEQTDKLTKKQKNLQTTKLDVNVLPDYKVELKNINSFRFLEKAINSEIERQEKILKAGKKVQQQTFGWDTEKQELKPQRVKEEAADYRYFPEPDIPPIRLTDKWISDLRNRISDLPDEIYQKLLEAGVSGQAAKVIAGDKTITNKLMEIIKIVSLDPSTIPTKSGSLRMTDIPSFANWLLHHQKEAGKKTVEELISLFKLGKEGIVSDSKQLEGWILEVIKANPQAVTDFRAGKQQAIGFLIGRVQKLAKGKGDPGMVRKLLLEKLK